MAAAIDKDGNALTGLLSALKIPPKTIGQYKTTTQLKQGLTLPADAKVISAPFDPQDPSTYSISNSIDLVDDAGRVRQGRQQERAAKKPSEPDHRSPPSNPSLAYARRR